jgi:hypothetical protein
MAKKGLWESERYNLVAELLPSTLKGLGSILSTTKKNKVNTQRKKKIKGKPSWALVAHAWKPTFLGC